MIQTSLSTYDSLSTKSKDLTIKAPAHTLLFIQQNTDPDRNYRKGFVCSGIINKQRSSPENTRHASTATAANVMVQIIADS